MTRALSIIVLIQVAMFAVLLTAQPMFRGTEVFPPEEFCPSREAHGPNRRWRSDRGLDNRTTAAVDFVRVSALSTP
jgi:hypothetical protein